VPSVPQSSRADAAPTTAAPELQPSVAENAPDQPDSEHTGDEEAHERE
jgi:hypothetical protein